MQGRKDDGTATFSFPVEDDETLRVKTTSSALPTGAATAAAQTDGTQRAKASPRIARVVHMASAALPAAGGYTANAAYAIPDGAQFVTLYCTYTRGAAGGYPKFRCDLGNGTETAVVQTLDPTITVAQPSGGQLAYNSEIAGPKPQDANPLVFALEYAVRGGATTIALQAAEVGVTGTPGTLAIALTAGY